MKQKTQINGKLLGAFLALATALALAMVACLLPGMAQSAYADGEHAHDGITFVEWTDALAQGQNGSSRTAANSLPNEPGNYYLTQDVTLTDRWNAPSGTTNLCLGGKTITGKLSESANHDSSVVNIEWDSTLNLYDDEGGTGKIVSEEYVFSEEGRDFTVLVRVVDTFDGTFNLYGGTLCATEGNQVYSGVYVNGGSFTMYGGTIRGARASGVDVGSRDGVFTMNGGTITGNGSRKGGGVFVQEDSTFTMNGGSITGNEALAIETKDEDGFPLYIGGQGGGVYVEADGSFTMNGGSITGNDAQRRGGGVYNAGTFNISGASEINGNIDTSLDEPIADNVYLERDTVVNVAGELGNAKPIGITMQAEKVFTSGGASGYKAKFASDDEGFTVAVKGVELMLQHLVHGMSYSASGATVTAECAFTESCNLPDGKVTLTIKAPALTTYGGAGSASATLEGLADFNAACGKSLAEKDIKYYKATKSGSSYAKDGDALAAAPTGAGDYLAEVSVLTRDEDNPDYVYASVGYTVAKVDLAVTAPTAKSLTYTGSAQELVVAGSAVGGTMLYALGDDATTPPAADAEGASAEDRKWSTSIPTGIDVGTYHVWYKVEGDDNHNDTAPACVSSTIERGSAPSKASISGAKVTLAKKKLVYDGSPKEPAVVSVTLDGRTLVAGTDYAVGYERNVEAGTAAAVVTGKGNYAGTARAAFKVVLGKAKLFTYAKPRARAMDVNWAGVPGAKCYELRWRESGGTWQVRKVASTSATVKGFKSGGFYDLRVRAVAGKAKGAWSPVHHRWFVRALGVTAKAGRSGCVDVTWKSNERATAGYLVVARYAKDGKNVARLRVTAGKTDATISGLKPGKRAHVMVRPLRSESGKTFRGILSHSARSSTTVR